ncbi:MAG: arginine--tRNA ligase [Proteobacteria bacterium]|nr:arginine--tRNA ligase [Pseudomonadota bacterium]
MRAHLEELVMQSLLHLQRDGQLPADLEPAIIMERTRNPDHGDHACNIAMILAKPVRKPPREIATMIINRMPESRHVEKAEIAGPGFINFFLTPHARLMVIKDVLREGEAFGCAETNSLEPLTVEFVSANPTGPLHVGHGRGAAYGATLSAVLQAAGHSVQCEYYVNDNGRQMDILAVSVWLRYLELCGEQLRFPDNGYRGEYVYDIARQVRSEHGDSMRYKAFEVFDDLPADESEGGDKELHIDALIGRCNKLIGDANFQSVFDTGLNSILDDIKEDLSQFGVNYDKWFSERDLEKSGAIDHAIDCLDKGGHLYKKEGATWFRASELGDEKDRVVIRENGRSTYFASDIAYFLDKMERGFSKALYIFGADHHGYIARLKAAAEGLDKNPDSLEILLVQFAVLYRGGEKIQMSTRSGKFVTLRQLREEVGNDASRFFYVMRSHDQHLDFNLDLAKSTSNDNPVYYIQYAHSRICSVFVKAEQLDMGYNHAIGEASLDLLTEEHEIAMTRLLSRYPETIETAARTRSPHMLAYYLQDLANGLHSYYNAHHFMVDNENLRNARLALIDAARQVFRNGLGIIGVSAPEKM